MCKRDTCGQSILYYAAVAAMVLVVWVKLTGVAHALTYKELAAQFEQKNGLYPGLLQAICQIESNWRPLAIGQEGEIGLCQLKVSTLHLVCPSCNPEVLLNPYDNLHWAAKYLKWLSRTLNTDDPYVLGVAFNGGHNGAVRYLLKLRKELHDGYIQSIKER